MVINGFFRLLAQLFNLGNQFLILRDNDVLFLGMPCLQLLLFLGMPCFQLLLFLGSIFLFVIELLLQGTNLVLHLCLEIAIDFVLCILCFLLNLLQGFDRLLMRLFLGKSLVLQRLNDERELLNSLNLLGLQFNHFVILFDLVGK